MQANQELALVATSFPQITKTHLKRASRFQGEWLELIDFLELDGLLSGIDRVRSTLAYQLNVKWFVASGCQLTIWGDENYPMQLQAWPDAPVLLWYQGSPAWKSWQFISVVGSRNPSGPNLEWMNWQLTEFLHESNVGIVSGGARGIDQRAHLLAIKSKKPTIALMPVGLKSRYPFAFREYEEAIIETGGAVVSLFPPDHPLFRGNFSVRNYVIAALSPMTLIVEARRRSGTMVTAHAALNLGKEILTIPTFPSNSSGQGNLDLLAEGATLIRDAKDLSVAWSRVVRPTNRPISEVSEDEVDPPDSNGGWQETVSGNSFG